MTSPEPSEERLAYRLVADLAAARFRPWAWRRLFRDALSASKTALADSRPRARSVLAWSVVALALGAAMLTGAALSGLAVTAAVALWAPWSLGAVLFVLLHLGMVRRDDGTPRGGLLIPNGLTLIRLTLAPLTIEPLWRVEPGTPAALVAVAGLGFLVISDSLDGVIARGFDQRSPLGQTLDPMADILLMGCLALGLWLRGLLPWPILVLMLLRYPGTLIIALTLTFWRGPKTIEPTILGKAVTALTGSALLLATAASLVLPATLDPGQLRTGLSFLAIPLAANLILLFVLAARWPRRDPEQR